MYIEHLANLIICRTYNEVAVQSLAVQNPQRDAQIRHDKHGK